MNAGNERFVETGEELDKGDFSSEGKDDIVENVVHQYWSPYTSNELPTRVSAAVAFHSLLQLLINTSRVLRKSPVIPSRNHAWLVFAADQVMDGNLDEAKMYLIVRKVFHIYRRRYQLKHQKAKLQPRRATNLALSQSHEPLSGPAAEFQFMPTPGIIPQHTSGPAAAFSTNDMQPNFSFENMVDDLQLMENEEQARMKAQRAKNRSILRDSVHFHAPRKTKPD
ncbi:CASP-like protein, partial [Forsythia ovata]